MNPVVNVFPLARLHEMVFYKEGYLGSYSYDFSIGIVMRVPDYIGMIRGAAFVCLEVYITFRIDWSRECMNLDIVQSARCRYNANGEALQAVPSLAE